MAGGDVEEGKFVRAGVIVNFRLRNRVSGIAQINEADPLDYPAFLDVETRDDPERKQRALSFSVVF